MIPFQLTDVAGPIEVLSSTSIPYLKSFQPVAGYPLSLAESGVDIEFHYVGETLDPITSTAACRLVPSATLADCPPLDYLLIGGPEPEFFLKLPKVWADFIREKAKDSRVKTIFTTCTGGMVAGAAGVLDGLNATTNHQCLPLAKQVQPSVKWTRETQWVEDGKFITAGGACAGMDSEYGMVNARSGLTSSAVMADWVLKHYGQEVAELGFAALDYEPRDMRGRLVPLKNGLRTVNN